MTDYTVTLIAPNGTDTPTVREYEVTALTAADALDEARGQATTADRFALAIGKSVVTAKPRTGMMAHTHQAIESTINTK